MFGHGGARENTGGHHVLTPERARARAAYEVERARHERVKRQAREFALAQRRSEYLPRDAQRAALALALGVLESTLRAVPGKLPPEAAAAVAEQIDAALSEVAIRFKAMA